MISIAIFDEVDGIDQIVVFFDGTKDGLKAAQQEAQDSIGRKVTLGATARLEEIEGAEYRFCQTRGYIG